MEDTQIQGKVINNGIINISEGEYRALEDDSSSSLKDFVDDRLKYYKKFITKTYVPEEDNVAMIIGKLVEASPLIMGQEGEIEEKFITSSIVNAPTATMLDFVEALYKRASECIDDEGVLTRDMKDLTLEAYNDVKFDRDGRQVAFKRAVADSYENVVIKFMGGEAYTYFKEILEVRKKGKTVITASLLEQANKIVDTLRTSSVTWKIFEPENVQVFNQLKINGFKIEGLPLKGMLDKVHVNHVNKTIQFYDLKVTWNVEDFYNQYYIKRRTYFQAIIYYEALVSTVCDLGFDYSDYIIQLPIFIVADSANFYEPLLYRLSQQDIEDAYRGFEYRGKWYKGLEETIRELKFAKENNIWNISYENYHNNGVVDLITKKEQ